jgi:hypothetical protein
MLAKQASCKQDTYCGAVYQYQVELQFQHIPTAMGHDCAGLHQVCHVLPSHHHWTRMQYHLPTSPFVLDVIPGWSRVTLQDSFRSYHYISAPIFMKLRSDFPTSHSHMPMW